MRYIWVVMTWGICIGDGLATYVQSHVGWYKQTVLVVAQRNADLVKIDINCVQVAHTDLAEIDIDRALAVHADLAESVSVVQCTKLELSDSQWQVQLLGSRFRNRQCIQYINGQLRWSKHMLSGIS